MSDMTPAIRLESSSRCSGVSEFIIRWAAAARRASSSTSSSRVCGLDGKKSPYLSMKSRNRSEEHTSELQSRQYLVCRLLLEKKNSQLTTLDASTTTYSTNPE